MKLNAFCAAWTPRILSVLRIVVALLILQHGLSKFLAFPMAVKAPPLFSLVWFAGLLEIAGGALLLAGFFTRAAAFILSGEMAFAYFISHAPRSFYPIINNGEAAVLFCFVFLYIAFAGPGPWSVDARSGRA